MCVFQCWNTGISDKTLSCCRLNQEGVEPHELLMSSAVGSFHDRQAGAALYLSLSPCSTSLMNEKQVQRGRRRGKVTT